MVGPIPCWLARHSFCNSVRVESSLCQTPSLWWRKSLQLSLSHALFLIKKEYNKKCKAGSGFLEQARQPLFCCHMASFSCPSPIFYPMLAARQPQIKPPISSFFVNQIHTVFTSGSHFSSLQKFKNKNKQPLPISFLLLSLFAPLLLSSLFCLSLLF